MKGTKDPRRHILSFFAGDAEVTREYVAGLLNQIEDDRAHAEAEKMRAHITEVIREHGIGYTDNGWYGAADLADPYQLVDGRWIRKLDGMHAVWLDG